MSVPIVASAWNHFQKISKEDFTGKIMYSIAMVELIKDFNEKDKKRLFWLRDNTHMSINTPVYELDRYVDPTKGQISNNSYTLDGESFRQDKIQYYLCLAIEEATRIIYRNFKDFKIEQKLGLDDYDDEQSEEWD